MRLLNVDTFRFAEFFYQTPPPYAILSHTWGNDSEEVSYSNVLAGRLDSPETRPAKVSGCCNQARRDGYKYVWIDTCCIDKTNLVELQEAINSMFRWYQEAAICYVYLADVPPGDEIHNPDSRFHAGRWFQRGWTLQELLAPLHVRFYDADWQCLGTKGELCEVIEDVTGIPSPYLLGIHEIHHASIAQRMSWAASRVTKREEDIAYCLLGIFGIVMPMIYGEGPNAFRRLQEHIMLKNTSDDSILSWGLAPSTPPGFSSALATHPSQFALSGQIVSRPQPGTDSLDVRAGTLRLHLRLLSQPGLDRTFGVLRCGPEHDPQMFVCLPLTRASGDDDGEFLRISQSCAVLERIDDSHQAVPCRIRVDGKPRQSATPAQAHFFHIQRSPAIRNLDIVDVQPPERWYKERSLIEAPALDGDGLRRAFVRLRDDKLASSDFVVVLEAVASGPTFRAQCDIMTASKDTPLSEIQGRLDDMRLRSHLPLRESADNGVLTLRVDLQSEAKQRTFGLRLEKSSEPPAETTNATLELECLRGKTDMECLLKVRKMVMEEDKALTTALKFEETALEDVKVELLGVEEEIRILLEKKAQLEKYKATRISALDDILKMSQGKALKLAKLDTWAKTADEPLGSVANNTPVDTENEQAKFRYRILHLAAKYGYDDLVQFLLEKGAPIEEPSSGRWTPLHLAAYNGHRMTVQQLLDKGANTEARTENDMTPLHAAVSQGHESTVRLLLERGAKMTRTLIGWTPLHLASRYGFESIARLLLDRGADVAAPSNKNWTPLHLAASHGHEETLSLLLDRGAPLSNALAGSKSTALHLASKRGREDAVRLLLQRGANPNLMERDRSTPLHSAASMGSVSIMNLLIEHGAQVGAVSRDGSVLAVAAHNGHEDAVRFLILMGADDADNQALAYASQQGHHAIVQILKEGQAGARKSPRPEASEQTSAADEMASRLTTRGKHNSVPAQRFYRQFGYVVQVADNDWESLATDSHDDKTQRGAEESSSFALEQERKAWEQPLLAKSRRDYKLKDLFRR